MVVNVVVSFRQWGRMNWAFSPPNPWLMRKLCALECRRKRKRLFHFSSFIKFECQLLAFCWKAKASNYTLFQIATDGLSPPSHVHLTGRPLVIFSRARPHHRAVKWPLLLWRAKVTPSFHWFIMAVKNFQMHLRGKKKKKKDKPHRQALNEPISVTDIGRLTKHKQYEFVVGTTVRMHPSKIGLPRKTEFIQTPKTEKNKSVQTDNETAKLNSF